MYIHIKFITHLLIKFQDKQYNMCVIIANETTIPKRPQEEDEDMQL